MWPEETPGFVEWANSLMQEGITERLFFAVNLVAFIVTTALAAVARLACSRETIVVMLAWLSFLMFGNAILHITGTVALGRYAPGTITSVLLYLPFFYVFVLRALRQFSIAWVNAAAVVAVAAFPMLLHGYLIIFRGSRLF